MRTKDHWTVGAGFPSGHADHWLAQDEDGGYWLPSKTRPEWWDRSFKAWRPTHWPYWLRARITNKIIRIEPEYETIPKESA
jgi:hypothetical protein